MNTICRQTLTEVYQGREKSLLVGVVGGGGVQNKEEGMSGDWLTKHFWGSGVHSNSFNNKIKAQKNTCAAI